MLHNYVLWHAHIAVQCFKSYSRIELIDFSQKKIIKGVHWK